MKVVYLPPYSPDFNPIELTFSLIKSKLRREGNITRVTDNSADYDTFAQLFEVVYSVSSSDAEAFFRHCRYIP